MALQDPAPVVQDTSPLECYEDAEWTAYSGGLLYERSVHYASSKVRRLYGVTDMMVSACLDCPLDYQRQMLVEGRCHPPAHQRPITPMERLEAERAQGE